MGAVRGRPPRPLEQRQRTGRSAGRDSGGRKLPEVVAAVPSVDEPGGVVLELPSAAKLPEVPAELYGDPDKCSYFPATPGGCEHCRADIAVTAWRRLWANGHEWLSMARDRDVLIRLCKGYAEDAHLRATIAIDGPWVNGQRGGLVAHPAVSMLRVLERELTKWEGLCGFNPSDGGRLGIKVGKGSGKSALETLYEDRAKKRAEREERAAKSAQRRTRSSRAAGSD